jgi:alpha-L-fucosidase 2
MKLLLNSFTGAAKQLSAVNMAVLFTLTPGGAQAADGIAAASDWASRVARYDVVWTSPARDATGVMPIGNGDIAAGVYAIEDGDLYLLLAKNDAFNFQGEIYKTGRVRVSVEPNPFKAGKPFRQSLDLPTGSIRIEANGVDLRIWADANRPVYHIQVVAPQEVTVTARPEFWKRLDGTGDVCIEQRGNIVWYFAVGDRSVYPDDLKFYQVEHMALKYPDPYRFNTFGHLLESPTLTLDHGTLSGKGTAIDIRIHALAMQAPEASKWVDRIIQQAARPVATTNDWEEHCRWWTDFWERSWILATDNTLPAEVREEFQGEPTPAGLREEDDGAALAAQSYNVFRFLMACQSRGRIQAKFNGGLFTQQLRVAAGKDRPGATQKTVGSWLTHEDDRLWGRRFTYQNQRLLYWPLLASGDFDLMKPFFDYYSNLLEMRKAITKAWFGHGGAYYRENIEPTGAERDCGKDGRPPRTKPGEKYEGWYHDYYFTSGLETLAMMTDYVRYTGDASFQDRVLVPFAREVLRFFDQHYPRGTHGKLRLEPAQVLETWWVAVNPAPDVGGLRFCLDELLAMKVGTIGDQAGWRKFRGEIPEVNLHEIEGHPAIAPAEKWEKKANAENGELYPVFPFRCFGLGLGSADIVAWTMRYRSCPDAFGNACWTQDQIHWAYAGKAAEAADGLVSRFRLASTMCRFPLYGREGPDSCPDFDHFGSGAIALQRMLVQEAGDRILLLPAWPADWDAAFKLHLAGKTIITGTVKDGKLLAWDVQPRARSNNVVVCQPQTRTSAAQPIPPNDHPLRAGSDQLGGSRFRGQIGRLTMFRGELSSSTIRELASGDRLNPVVNEQLVASWLNPKPGDALAIKAEDFRGPVSFEGWIQPAEGESGRVLDKITVAGHDGFLLDAWPRLSLRLIVGPLQRDFENVLKAGVWQHVAVVINRGTQRVYLDGAKQ